MAARAQYIVRHEISRILRPFVFILLGAVFSTANATGPDSIKSFRLEDEKVIVEFEDSPGSYFLLQQSSGYVHWEPTDMSLGIPSETLVDPATSRLFLRAVPTVKVC